MPAFRDRKIAAILTRHKLKPADAFHLLMSTLTDSHLQTIHNNRTGHQPAYTIMQALDLAVYNEYEFTTTYARQNHINDETLGNRDGVMSMIARDRAEMQSVLIDVLRECQAAAEEIQAMVDADEAAKAMEAED